MPAAALKQYQGTFTFFASTASLAAHHLAYSSSQMSRFAHSKAAPPASRPGDQDGELLLQRQLSQLRLHRYSTDVFLSDICPVCKSSRYLNKSMRFLVNPECYHKMCESCVDRIFSHGPNKCPIAGCHRTLRKHRFREQTFEDIQVEREVDVRKRVATVFNRREDEFDSLLDYNNYLNEVEDITFNLVNLIDTEAMEKKMASYATQNSKSISANAALASEEMQDYSALQAAEREQARLRREAVRREEEDERRARAEGRQDILNRLATGTGDAATIAEEGHRVTLKKRLDKRAAVDRQRQLQAAPTEKQPTNGNGGFVIKGLKTRKDAGPEAPYDSFGGLKFVNEYHILQDQYDWDWLNGLRDDVTIVAGGYSLHEFQTRALCEAFSGLGVIVGEDRPGTGVKDVKMEDPF